MILYLEDWQKHPGAIVDLQTQNRSFLQMSALYRDMGVKNHAFLLALHNKELQGIDPHRVDLSLEQMAKIAIECKENPWYFFREVARVPMKGSPDAVPFRAHRGNMALYWLYFNHITTILVQIRQTGKSVAMDVLDIYLLNIAAASTTIALLTKDDGLRSFNLDRLKEIQSELPFYLNLKGYDDISNTEMMTIKKLGNEFRALVPQKSPKAALSVGRGLTVPTLKFDEAAFIANIAISAPAALAAGTAARDAAKKMGTHYGTIFATTAGKKDDRDGRFMYELLINSAVWSELFFDLRNRDELENVVRTNSPKRQLRVNCTFNHRQLGFTDEWLKNAIEETVGSGEDIERDFFNKWTSGSQLSPLPVDLSEKIRASQIDPAYLQIFPQGYVLRWYISEETVKKTLLEKTIIMGLDSSDAVGADDIAVTIRDTATGAVLGAGNFNETNLFAFTEWLLHVLITYKKMTLVIERRSTAAMIIDYLCLMMIAHNINPFTRIFNKVVQNAEEDPVAFQQISKAQIWQLNDLVVKYKKSFGFATSATGMASRTELYSTTLLSCAKYTAPYTHDKTIIDQVLGLVIKNGRVDHEDGGHDDSVIAWLLPYWLLTKGKNLSYYSIASHQILTENNLTQQERKKENSYENQEQLQIKDEITDLIEKLKNTRDEFIVSKYESRLRFLYTKYDSSLGQIMSYDDLIKELKDFRSRQMREKKYSISHRSVDRNKTVFRI